MTGSKPVLAEYQIQEADIEGGSVEIEYRGAYHWGIPKAAEGDGDEDEAASEPAEVNDTRQSHELELQMGINDWWLIQLTTGFDQPLGDNLHASSVELEGEFALLKREGNGIALSFQFGYEQAINHGPVDDFEANEFGFGPIVEWAQGPFLLTLNPIFSKQIGTYADQEGLGFEYGWRGEYDFAKHWGIGVEMFGNIEDLANAGSFNDQEHSIGPTLFWKPGGDDDDKEAGDVGGDDDDDNGKVTKAPETEFSMNVGLQFGLTDVTSDTALKFQGSLEF